MTQKLTQARLDDLLERYRTRAAGFDAVAARRAAGVMPVTTQKLFPVEAEQRGRPSAREVEVLALAAEGQTNEQMARVLFLSEDTVKSHLVNVRRKLRARNRAHAVAIAYRSGFLGSSAGSRAA
jgi:DNA-binding CsgD family transcriptional regulator